MSQLIDLTGKRFGRLTVIKRDGSHVRADGQSRPTWRCRCDCGNETIVIGANLRTGFTRSCGCLRKETLSLNGKKRRLPKNIFFKFYRFFKTFIYDKIHILLIVYSLTMHDV